MNFWKLAYECKWVDAKKLCGAVLTEDNPYGEITTEEYKEITTKEYPTKQQVN